MESGEGNSASADNFMSMEESSNNQKGRKKQQKRIPPAGKGTRKWFLLLLIITMTKLRTWLTEQLEKAQSSPLWRLLLSGMKGQLEAKNPKPYNFYIKCLSIGSTIALAYYFLLFRKN